jgi:hypothetical protein
MNVDIEREKEGGILRVDGDGAMMEVKQSTSFGPMITNAARSFAKRDESGIQELREAGWGRIPFMQELVMAMREMPNESPGMIETMQDKIAELLNLFGIPNTGIQLPLASLLTIFEKTEATISRDKLIARLGLAQDGQHEDLRPNYDESTEAVLLRSARYFVKSGHRIAMMYQAGISGREIQLPSWVSDWTDTELQKSRVLSLGSQTGLCYAAASETEPEIRLADVEDELIVSGS